MRGHFCFKTKKQIWQIIEHDHKQWRPDEDYSDIFREIAARGSIGGSRLFISNIDASDKPIGSCSGCPDCQGRWVEDEESKKRSEEAADRSLEEWKQYQARSEQVKRQTHWDF